jgi:hypothetical protein
MSDERNRRLKLFTGIFNGGRLEHERGANPREPGSVEVYIPENESQPGLVVVINNMRIDDSWMAEVLRAAKDRKVVVFLSDNTNTPVDYTSATKLRGMLWNELTRIFVVTNQKDVEVLTSILGRALRGLETLPEMIKKRIMSSKIRTVTTYTRKEAELAYNAYWESLEALEDGNAE